MIGLDSSPAMLAEAADAGAYHELIQTDISEWQPNEPPALIISNAALIWVQGHDVPLPKLAGMLAPGGVLAAQMPREWEAASHRFIGEIVENLFPERVLDIPESPVHAPLAYWHMLSAMGQVSVWETDYVQRLESGSGCHSVRAFTQSTALRPFLDRMTKGGRVHFWPPTDAGLEMAYPVLTDGAAVMTFRRVSFTLQI